MKNFHTIAHKASLKTRLRVALNVMRNRPVVFRVGIEHADVYIPETMYAEHFHRDYCIIRMVDSKGDVIPYDSLIPMEDSVKLSCDCIEL